MTSTVRGITGALLFAKGLLDGKSVDEARAATRETMSELAPLVDPAIEALDDVARKRALRKAATAAQARPPRAAEDDGVTVIDTTGEEVPEPRRKAG